MNSQASGQCSHTTLTQVHSKVRLSTTFRRFWCEFWVKVESIVRLHHSWFKRWVNFTFCQQFPVYSREERMTLQFLNPDITRPWNIGINNVCVSNHQGYSSHTNNYLPLIYFGPILSPFIHILRSYTATVKRFISIGSKRPLWRRWKNEWSRRTDTVECQGHWDIICI